MSFRREAHTPYGGPNGGDGGRGGDVVVCAGASFESIDYFKGKGVFKAAPGKKGLSRNLNGRSGESLIMRVPEGTAIYKVIDGERRFTARLPRSGMKTVLAVGGAGGRGNTRFAAASNKVPLLAEAGEEGETAEAILALEKTCDVVLLGKPNSGKSTLLASITNAKPKIDVYPFTTIKPVSGLVADSIASLLVVEIPAIAQKMDSIPSVTSQFLLYIANAQCAVYLIAADDDDKNCLETLRTLVQNAKSVDDQATRKPSVVVLSKCDMLNEVEEESIVKSLRNCSQELFDENPAVMSVDANSEKGIASFIDEIKRLVALSNERNSNNLSTDWTTEVIIRPLEHTRAPADTLLPAVQRTDENTFVINHRKAVRISRASDLNNPEALAQFRRKLNDWGIITALEKTGLQPGDVVILGEKEFIWE